MQGGIDAQIICSTPGEKQFNLISFLGVNEKFCSQLNCYT